ncbi:MAG: type II toxin-antitoxin system RelE/ParE family toxin [Methylohalobius crimeensis]
MIKSFQSKALSDLWAKGYTAKIDAKMHQRILRRLDRLNSVLEATDMNQPGFNFRGFTPKRYSVHINGPWCITFEFENGDAYRVNFEQY